MVTEYAMVLPFVEIPAMDEVTRNTPPSALALNVGSAFRRRCRLALQFTAQFWASSQLLSLREIYLWYYLVPFCFVEGIQIAISGIMFGPSLLVSDKPEEKHAGIEFDALNSQRLI